MGSIQSVAGCAGPTSPDLTATIGRFCRRDQPVDQLGDERIRVGPAEGVGQGELLQQQAGPSLLVEDVPASARFYVEHFGFRPRLELDWFTTLTHDDRPYELGFLRADHPVVPEGHRARRADGLIIGLQVLDATEEDARLRAAGVRVVLPLRHEPFGQRHVIVADPNDVLVDVVQPIPADPNWLAQQGRQSPAHQPR